MRPIRLRENIEMQITALAKSGAVLCETNGKGFTSAMEVYEACVREYSDNKSAFIKDCIYNNIEVIEALKYYIMMCVH